MRTLEQIIAEINPNFQAQTKSLQQQQALIPGQIREQETALGARKDSAFGDILSGARRRGTGVAFGGIPLAEQSKYLATDYMPALANLRSQGQQQAMSLQDAILGINERRDTLGQQIYQTEQDRAFQASEAAKNRAAQAAASAPADLSRYFQQMQTQGQTQQSGPRAVQTQPGSFGFFDAANKPITAGMYARQTNQDIRDVLFDMGSSGDATATQLYNQLRQVPDNMFDKVLAQVAPNYQHIFNGYVTGAPKAPLASQTPRATTTTPTRQSSTFSPYGSLSLGGIR